MPRILIADDHPGMRRRVREALETEAGFIVCAEASNGVEAVALAASERPDIVILDLSMPELNGLEAAKEIHRQFPLIEMLILTMYDPLDLTHEEDETGIRSCILKTDFQYLMTTVRGIWQRQFHMSTVRGIWHRSLQRASAPANVLSGAAAAARPADELTSVERTIVQMLAQAKSNKEIAVVLDLTVTAVEVYRAAIMHKLEMSSIVDLVRYAVQNKLVATKSS
jgi:DNA-binding NarL/FixJ family response regulator